MELKLLVDSLSVTINICAYISNTYVVVIVRMVFKKANTIYLKFVTFSLQNLNF